MVPAEVWFLAMSEGLVVGTTLTVTAGASTTTDYVAVALGGFAGGALALVGSGMTGGSRSVPIGGGRSAPTSAPCAMRGPSDSEPRI